MGGGFAHFLGKRVEPDQSGSVLQLGVGSLDVLCTASLLLQVLKTKKLAVIVDLKTSAI